MSNSEEVLNPKKPITGPGHNKSTYYMRYFDSVRCPQLHLLWLINFCLSASLVLFSMQVIFSEALVIDAKHTFCKGNLFACLIAAILSPIFGFLFDIMGFRMSSFIACSSLALACFFMNKFTEYSDLRKFAYLLGVHAATCW